MTLVHKTNNLLKLFCPLKKQRFLDKLKIYNVRFYIVFWMTKHWWENYGDKVNILHAERNLNKTKYIWSEIVLTVFIGVERYKLICSLIHLFYICFVLFTVHYLFFTFFLFGVCFVLLLSCNICFVLVLFSIFFLLLL